MTPRLSIAVVLYNSGDWLADCLRSLRSACDSVSAEVIAVDNASPDDSVAILRDELPSARLVRFDTNRGFAAGANAALAQATGHYWLLLNPDILVPRDGLVRLLDWMAAHPKVGAASPDIHADDGRWESPGRAAPSILRTMLELSRLHRALPRRLRGQVLRGPYWIGGDQLGVGWVPGTAMIVNPHAARQVGVLREDLFMYGEDIEWCWRMRRAGWDIGVCSATTFVHRTSSSARRTWGEDEQQRRIVAGVDAACRSMYGAAHARALAIVTALALALDAVGSGRASGYRTAVRHSARIWWEQAAKR